MSLALIALAPAVAFADAPPPPSASDVVSPNDPKLGNALRQDIEARQYDQALDLLAQNPDFAASEDGYRLHIKLLVAARRTDKALALLERYLNFHPNDGWSRFEIAEIQYAHGRGGVAAVQYRLAMAGDLDAPDAVTARARLTDLSLPPSWRFGYGANLSATSNVDGAVDDGRSYLVGLPIVLDNPAIKGSTLAVSGYGRAEKFTPLTDDMGLHAAVLVAASTGPAKSYDSEAISAEAGPEWTLEGLTHVALTARSLIQWVSQKPAASGGGLAVHADTYGENLLWAGQVNVDDIAVRYPNTSHGLDAKLDLRRTRYLTASTFWSLGAQVERAGVALFSSPYTSEQLKVGRLFKMPWSSLVYVEETSRLRVYDHDILEASSRRADTLDELSFRFSKRNMVFYRGVPFITLSASKNTSNIPVYDYSQLKVDFGVTRGF